MLSINALTSGVAQLKYQSSIKTSSAQPAASTDIAKPVAKPIKANAVDAVAKAPKADPKPFNLFAGSFAEIFNNFDNDKNGLVTRDEIVKNLQAIGADEKTIESFVNNVLSATTDVNDDGALSMSELNRRIKMDAGDAFAGYDLNSDGKITSEELDDAMKRFKSVGWAANPERTYKIFAEADLDDNKTLTRAEFDNFSKYGRPTEETRAFEVIFNQFDANGDGRVTRDEALSALKAQGADDKSAEAFLANMFAATSDVNGDGAIDILELRRRVAADKGDTFAMADLDSDGKVTAEELENAVSIYQKAGNKFDADMARKAFFGADADKNGVLTRAEFAASGNKPSDAVVATPAKPVQQPANITVAAVSPVKSSKAANTDIDMLKPQLSKMAPAMIDADLLVLLQEGKA